METVRKHAGTIVAINEHEVVVEVQQHAACASCHAKRACFPSEHTTLQIHVQRDVSFDGTLGDKVLLIAPQSEGIRALALAYLIPLVLVLCTFAAAQICQLSELLSAGLALGILIPYWGWMHYREKLGCHRTHYRLETIN